MLDLFILARSILVSRPLVSMTVVIRNQVPLSIRFSTMRLETLDVNNFSGIQMDVKAIEDFAGPDILFFLLLVPKALSVLSLSFSKPNLWTLQQLPKLEWGYRSFLGEHFQSPVLQKTGNLKRFKCDGDSKCCARKFYYVVPKLIYFFIGWMWRFDCATSQSLPRFSIASKFLLKRFETICDVFLKVYGSQQFVSTRQNISDEKKTPSITALLLCRT